MGRRRKKGAPVGNVGAKAPKQSKEARIAQANCGEENEEVVPNLEEWIKEPGGMDHNL